VRSGVGVCFVCWTTTRLAMLIKNQHNLENFRLVVKDKESIIIDNIFDKIDHGEPAMLLFNQRYQENIHLIENVEPMIINNTFDEIDKINNYT
jgi:hypothetical protein